MRLPLEGFIRALRAAEVPVSVAEAIDAHQVLAKIGYTDRELTKNALAVTLAKTIDEKQRFSESFDGFFSRSEFSRPEDSIFRKSEKVPSGRTGSDLADKLLVGDREGLAIAMETAAREVGLEQIQFATQINFFTRRLLDLMGLAEMERAIESANQGGSPNGGADLVEALERARTHLFAEAKNYVERQFLLHSRYSSEQLRTNFLERTPFAAIDRRDFERMNRLIRRMARKLSSRYLYRHKLARRGHLDVKRTIRHNMAYNGMFFEPIWKKKKIDTPKIVAICDVSRSVAAAAKFLLLFLYNLNEIIPDVRSFAFSSYLIEIAKDLDTHNVEDAIPVVLEKIGFMPTDYGRALKDLKEQFGEIIDRRTTVFILGDARSNYGNGRSDIMRWINQRARRVVWLNPEPETFWGTGDSEMLRYRPYCHVAKACRNIKQLERIIDDTLRSTTRL